MFHAAFFYVPAYNVSFGSNSAVELQPQGIVHGLAERELQVNIVVESGHKKYFIFTT